MSTPLVTAARRASRVSLLVILPAVALFPLAEVLQFDRKAIAAGQWWRLVTGHWTHWSLDHLWWDGAVFLVLAAVCERLGRRLLFGTIGLSVVACTAAVWWLAPDLATYRGLSGIDSALFAAVGTTFVRRSATSGDRRRAIVPTALVCAFAAKTTFEAVTGTTLFMDSAAAGAVAVPIAHVAGAVTGVLVGLVGRR